MESESPHDAMTGTARRKVISALSWSFLETLAMRGIQFITGIVLARLLFPEQFGLIGMLLIFIALARTLMEGGFGAALIQKVGATQTDICSIFYFNILLGLLTAGTLCLAAPWIAEFYNQPVLTPLTRVLSLTIVINSFGMIQGNLFYKEINFKAHTMTSLIAGLLSGAVGIGFAIAGFGVWSLAIQQVSASVFRSICLWVFSPWRPSLIFSFESLRKMFGFGSRLLFSGLLDQIFENVYFVVVGKLFSAADLGLFTRARTLQDLPTQSLSLVMGRVAFPVFSMCQDDLIRLKRGLQKASSGLALLTFPLMIGLAVTARPLVIVLLGQKWAGCIPFLRLFCAVGLMYPLYSINTNTLLSIGRSDLLLRLGIINKGLTVANIAITWRWGISAIISGMITALAVTYYLSSRFTRDLIDYSYGEQLRDLYPYLIVAGLMGAAVFSVGLLQFPGYLLMLLAQALTGAVVYVGLCWTFRLSAFVEARHEVCDRVPFLRTRQQAC